MNTVVDAASEPPTAKTLHNDRATAAGGHLAGRRNVHALVPVRCSRSTAVAGNLHVAATGGDFRAGPRDVYTEIGIPRARTAGARHGGRAAGATLYDAGVADVDATLASATVVAAAAGQRQ